jgi:hypothetical protein
MSAESHTNAVRESEQKNHRDGNRLFQPEFPRDGFPQQMQRRGRPDAMNRNHGGEECRKACTQRGVPRRGYHEAHPAVEKSPQIAIRGANVDIFAARFRHHAAEFGERQCAGERHESGDDPCHHHHPGRADFLRHDRRLKKHAGPDHRADHKRSGPGEIESADELTIFIGHE